MHLNCKDSNQIDKLVYLYNYILARNEYPSVKLFELMNKQYPIIFVWGYVNNPQKGKIINAWNIVKIENNFYHLDATFDITRNPNSLKGTENPFSLPSVKSTEFCSKYLLVSDKIILNSHLWNKKFYPLCKSSYPRCIIMNSIKNLRFQGVQFNYKQNY